jgi:hypothetical protein
VDIFEAIQLKALRDVHKFDSNEYMLRRLYRWFSSTYHVPITETDAIPVTTMLQHYFESYYESMSSDKRLKEINKLFQDVAEIEKQKDAMDAEDEDFVKQLTQDIEKEKKKKKVEDLQKALRREKDKNQNVIQRLGNSPAADSLRRFMAEADALAPRKK